MSHTSSNNETSEKKELRKEFNEIKSENKRLSWKFAERCYKSKLFFTYRNKSVEKDYKEFKASTKKKWDDVSSRIKHEVFGMQCWTVYSPLVKTQYVEEPIEGYFFHFI